MVDAPLVLLRSPRLDHQSQKALVLWLLTLLYTKRLIYVARTLHKFRLRFRRVFLQICDESGTNVLPDTRFVFPVTHERIGRNKNVLHVLLACPEILNPKPKVNTGFVSEYCASWNLSCDSCSSASNRFENKKRATLN